MPSAKMLYKDLNRIHLSHYFKSVGWKQKGYSWQYLDSESNNYIDVYVQPYYITTDEQVRFLTGIDVCNNDFVIWHNELNKASKAHRSTAPPFTGEKVVDDEGRWIFKIEQQLMWDLFPGDTAQAKADKIISQISLYLQPYLAQHHPVNDAIRHMLEGAKTSKPRITTRTRTDYNITYCSIDLPMIKQ